MEQRHRKECQEAREILTRLLRKEDPYGGFVPLGSKAFLPGHLVGGKEEKVIAFLGADNIMASMHPHAAIALIDRRIECQQRDRKVGELAEEVQPQDDTLTHEIKEQLTEQDEQFLQDQRKPRIAHLPNSNHPKAIAAFQPSIRGRVVERGFEQDKPSIIKPPIKPSPPKAPSLFRQQQGSASNRNHS